MVREDTGVKKEGAEPPRDANTAKEEVAVGDVTVNKGDCASKNNTTSVVL